MEGMGKDNLLQECLTGMMGTNSLILNIKYSIFSIVIQHFKRWGGRCDLGEFEALKVY